MKTVTLKLLLAWQIIYAVCCWVFVIGLIVIAIRWMLKPINEPSLESALTATEAINSAAFRMSDKRSKEILVRMASSIVREYGPFTNEDGSVLVLLPAKESK